MTKQVTFPSKFTCTVLSVQTPALYTQWACVSEPKTLAGSHLMTFPTYWGWQAIATVLWVLGCKTYFTSAGCHFSLFHPPRSGNENDVPLVRGKNSPPWRVRRATPRASCLNEIPVCDEWEVRGLLGNQTCAAAGLCPVQTLTATVLCLFPPDSFKLWKALDGDSDPAGWMI